MLDKLPGPVPYLLSKISLWSIEKSDYLDFNQFENVVFRILKIQYLTKVFLNFKGAL